jgi:hypothetical protein
MPASRVEANPSLSDFYLCFACNFAADIISTVEFNHDGELLATGDKGGRIVIFQKDDAVSVKKGL